ncbi:IPT/TIG domain-containing protein [Glaciihabitans sp. dw_435]|uniref:IPT/TIG domain-containing protein n=1 Tax=Glaciihabitans sp. dw_435 TaxID=2720081 RepID=UPI001BD650F1|nr:IPT/TIG domain-containing protein [Glaciihabitans sp. dw_435]
MPTPWRETRASANSQTRNTSIRNRSFTALAALTVGATLAFTTGIGGALAAPGDSSSASGQFLSGSLFNQPLGQVVNLGGVTATNNGTQPTVTNRDNLDLSVLNAISISLPGGIQLPLDIANAGVISQYATATPDGASTGASGAVANDGTIGVANVPPSQVPGDLTFNLGNTVSALGLGTAITREVADLGLNVGAVSSRATKAAPGAASGSYEIDDLSLQFKSATLGNLVTSINNQVAALQTTVNGLDASLSTSVLNIPLLNSLAVVDLSVSTPTLGTALAGLLTGNITNGAVTINLSTGVVTVDIGALTALNGLPPSTSLLTGPQVAAIGASISAAVSGLVTTIGTRLQNVINGITVVGNVSVLTVPVITINTTVGGLLSNSSAGLAVIGIPIQLGAVLSALVGPLSSLGNVTTSLLTTLLTPVTNLVLPALSPVINGVVSLTANVQSNTGGVFRVTALRTTILPAGAALVGNLGSSSVGPNVAEPDPTISTMTPVSGPEAGGTTVNITGTNLDTASSVTIGGRVVTTFTATETTLSFVTPTHLPGPVTVVVNAPQGDSASRAFTYLAAPSTATSLTPTSGTEVGGTPVTITGDGFIGATGVTFGGTPGTAFSVINDNTISVTTPTHAPGLVNVVVQDAAGNSSPLGYTFLAIASTASSLTPTTGPPTGGTPVTITGSGFTGATSVTFGGAPGTAFSVVNDTTITVTSPAHGPGAVDVVVVDAAGNSTPLTFTYVPVAAAVTSITPVTGPDTGGTGVTITGSGFLGATGVTFDGTPGTAFTVVSDTSITVTSPPHAAGAVNLIVVDPAGNSAARTFTYTAAPSAITSLTPNSGTELGGTPVTIRGTGFTGATGVTFDGLPGTAFTLVNDTTITVTSPRHAPGGVAVVVQDVAGNTPQTFTYLASPSAATSLTPTSGAEIGGTPVTITGSGFTGATGVTFGGTPAAGFTVVDDTTITVTTPLHAPGAVDVIVVDAAGNSDPLGFTFLSIASNTTAITPDSGPEIGGTPVTITGSGFTGASSVTFGGVAGTDFVVVNDTTITATTPRHAPGATDVVVVDPLGGNSSPLTFTFGSVASDATSVAPDSGTELGGTAVIITGTGFTGATGVTFDGVAGTVFSVVNDTTIAVTTPPHAPGVVDLVVVDAAGGNSAPIDFEFTADASDATSLAPTTGSEAGGTVVTITGTGFTGATGVTFGGAAGTNFTVVNDTTITVTSPAGAPGTVDVVVLDAAGGNSGPLDFTYVAVGSVATSLDPATGDEAGGTDVTITGSGFIGATDLTVDGDSVPFVIVDDTTITFSTPPHATGVVDVDVVDPQGNSDPLEFEYGATASTITSLTPLSGDEAGGTTVIITGSGLIGSTGVTFDGIAGANFTRISDTSVSVESPPHTPGLVNVQVIDPAGNSGTLTYTYTATASDPDSLTPPRAPWRAAPSSPSRAPASWAPPV